MRVSKLMTSPRAARSRFRAIAALTPIALAIGLLAGCTASGDSADQTAPTSDSTGDGVYIVVIGGSGDPFFSAVKRGVDSATTAVEAAGGSVEYLALKDYTNLGADTAQLTRTAVGKVPDVIAVPDWVPEAQDPAIKEAIDAGIEVVLYNAGDIQMAEDLGAVTYIGTDDYLAGIAAGEALGGQGVTKALCVNTVPGSVNIESRCTGVEEGITKSGGTSEELFLPSSNFGDPTAVAQAIKSALATDSSIDALVAIASVDAVSAATAIEQAGAEDRVTLISFDLSSEVLSQIKSGEQFAAVDQQPFAQGFYAVTAAFQLAAYGVELPTKPLLTGPLIVDSSNVDTAIAGADAGVR